MAQTKVKGDQTIVIFRRWRSTGEVIALFPEIPATLAPQYCESYEHYGQPGAADPAGVIDATDPARPEDYAALKAELETIVGYKLAIRQRMTREMFEVRVGAIAKAKGK